MTTHDTEIPDTETPDTEPPEASDEARTITRGLRIREVRLASAAKMAFVFFAVGYVATLGALVVLWNVMQWVGFVAEVEDILTSSLGLDSVTISGADLLGLAIFGIGIIALFGFVFTMLAVIIYNAAGNLFGGLHVNTTLTRRRPIRSRGARRRRSR